MRWYAHWPYRAGYDTCFVRSHNGTNSTLAVELYSPASGIKLSISSDQHAIQLYSCDGLDGSIPAKASQGGQDGVVYGQYRFVIRIICAVPCQDTYLTT